MTTITLLTDFGLQDEYIGVLKGVIRGINPTVTIIDVTHGIAPQNVVAAAYTLKAAFTFFPLGTIHVAVVDPGVGTQRNIVAVRCGGHLFLAPDNGLLGPIMADHAPEAGYQVENENLFRHPVCPTFHGRDVFAPVAAHLAQGLPLKALGRPLNFDRLRPLDVREARIDPSGTLEGEVVSVDRFGNLITNIGSRLLSALGPGKLEILLGDHTISGMAGTYAQGTPGKPMAVIGSRDCLEIAVNGGSATQSLKLAYGEIVRVRTVAP